MQWTEDRIASLVDRVIISLKEEGVLPESGRPSLPSGGEIADSGVGVFPDMDTALKAAQQAFEEFSRIPIEARKGIIRAMREAALGEAVSLAELAREETGLGRASDKAEKNRLVAEKTPGVEELLPEAWSGDHGLTLTERAPFGVIGAVTPVTNPSSTIICNSIGMVAGGNAVVFNPHPTARRTSIATLTLLNRAIASAGGPETLLCTVRQPTIETAVELMHHRGIRLLVVTGGPGVVRAALNSGKKVIAAGPGNPPVVVDETADLARAARDIVQGGSFDNNLVCILEKVIIVVEEVADELKRELGRHYAVEVRGSSARRLIRRIIAETRGPRKRGIPDKAFVGKDAAWILQEVLDREVDPETRMVVIEVDRENPLVWTEQLMPVLPLVRVPNVEEAIAFAKEVEEGCGHTASMHSRNIENLSRMARMINTSIFVKNGPTLAGLGYGGEGFTSFTIASPTGEGLTSAIHFTRKRRCVIVDSFRIV